MFPTTEDLEDDGRGMRRFARRTGAGAVALDEGTPLLRGAAIAAAVDPLDMGALVAARLMVLPELLTAAT